jgi:hypothetical protein
MKKIVLVAVLVAAMTGCAGRQARYAAMAATGAPNSTQPKVHIKTNNAGACQDKKAASSVGEEPLTFFADPSATPFPITWEIVTGKTEYEFDKPIKITTLAGPADEIYDCKLIGPSTAQCMNKGQHAGKWKYSLFIKQKQNCGKRPDLDPQISNE